MDRHRATLVSSEAISPTVRHLVLRADAPLGYEAGQWLNLHVPVSGGATEKRAYSIANAQLGGESTRDFEIIVTRVPDGAASPVLHELPVGEHLEWDGPHGFFVRDPAQSDPLLFVGTGTGLAPLRAIVQDTLANTTTPVTLLFGCRAQEDILFRTELDRWVKQYPRFALQVTLSRAGEDWNGRRGYVQKHLVDVIGRSRPRVFICGLSPMVKQVRQVLKTELGYDRKMIQSERYD